MLTKMAFLGVCLFVLGKVHPIMAQSSLYIDELRCEYRTNPIGMDELNPRLSWKLFANNPIATNLSQSAYHIQVFETDTNHLVWDTQKVISSDQSADYTGEKLLPTSQYRWHIRVWDQNEIESEWSPKAYWFTGILGQSKAQWIGEDRRPYPDEEAMFHKDPAPIFRKQFTLDKAIKTAYVHVTGLGYYEFYLNNQRIGNHELDPAWTTYDQRIFYSTYDVTSLLKKGENAMGLLLGNGWYNPLPLRMWGHINLREHLTIGLPCGWVQLELTFEDGTKQTIISDPTWKSSHSQIMRNSVYLGEHDDASQNSEQWTDANFNDLDWQPVVLANAPSGQLIAQPIEPIRITQTLKPINLTKLTSDTWIIDFGQNLAGRVALHCKGPGGTHITIRYGELLNPDGSLNYMTSVAGQIKNRSIPEGSMQPSTAWQEDSYILSGLGEETWSPRFTFHGFRYIEVRGFPGTPTVDNFSIQRLHTDVRQTGTFECSAPLFNKIHEITAQSLLSNLHGVQSDCPHREKFGYGGDLVADSAMAIANYDMASFYNKVTLDVADAVRPNGGFTETAPFVGIADHGLGENSGPIEWGTVHPLFLIQQYKHYGNKRLIKQQYPLAQRWFQLLESTAQNGILDNGLGDHESLVEKDTKVSGTAFYFYNATLMAQLANILGYHEEAAEYQHKADAIGKAFENELCDPLTGKIGIGSQTCQAMAFWFGLVPQQLQQKAKAVLLDDIKSHGGALTTGIFGTRMLLQALCELDAEEVAYQLVGRREFPSWGHMIDQGATTLWEHWEFSDSTFSHNHPMFGSVDEWFYGWVGGIRPAKDAYAMDKLTIRPYPNQMLTWAKASQNTERGLVKSEWQLHQNYFELKVAIPVNTKARIIFPYSGSISKNGELLNEVLMENGHPYLDVGSGKYLFTLTQNTQ